MATSKIEKVTPTNGSNTNGSYIKFPDGILMQFGSKSIGNGTTAFTFPLAFNSVLSITASCGAGSTRQPVYVEDVLNNGFNAHRPDTAGNEWFRWIAIGRWK